MLFGPATFKVTRDRPPMPRHCRAACLKGACPGRTRDPHAAGLLNTVPPSTLLSQFPPRTSCRPGLRNCLARLTREHSTKLSLVSKHSDSGSARLVGGGRPTRGVLSPGGKVPAPVRGWLCRLYSHPLRPGTRGDSGEASDRELAKLSEAHLQSPDTPSLERQAPGEKSICNRGVGCCRNTRSTRNLVRLEAGHRSQSCLPCPGRPFFSG